MIRPFRRIAAYTAVVAVLYLAGCSSAADDRHIRRRIVLPDSAGVTVFELLKSHHEVEYRQTPSGIFVTGIDSISNTTSSYWMYFVNDSAGTTASDRRLLFGREKVEWRYISAE